MRSLISLYLLISIFLCFTFCVTQVGSFGVINANEKQDEADDASSANVDVTTSVTATTATDSVEADESVSDVDTGAGTGTVNASHKSDADSSTATAEVPVKESETHTQQPQDMSEESVDTNEAGSDDDNYQQRMDGGDNGALHETKDQEEQEETQKQAAQPVVQSGPFIDLFGDTLLSLEMVDETHAKLNTHYTNEALAGKKVIGLYFSADWCGPCRNFTPELVSFYDKINKRKNDTFEIVWISRCRDVQSYGQYFTHMKWLALPPEEAMGARGQMLGQKFKVKGIPHFVLLDELGSVITYDARNKIPQDKAGIGFPWRNPLATLYITLVPKSLRLMVKTHVDRVKDKIEALIKK